jgi:peptidoglycan/xylan/chitin deacetylase (PgdA/CDA1 family)
MPRRKRILALTGVLLIVAAFAANASLNSIYRLPILMYHSIEPSPRGSTDRLIVSPEAFEKQMAFLRARGYNVIRLDEAVNIIRDKKPAPRKTVAITLDDGYENNYRYAYPVLKKYEVPVTIFIVTNFVGRKGFLTWSQISEMSGSGLVDFESHTKTHYWLTEVTDAKLRDELTASKAALESRLGEKARFLCYPMGNYDERVKSAARAAGYEAAFATKPTRISPNYDVYEIKRVRISRTADNLFVFWIKVSGYHAFFRVLDAHYRDIPYIIWRHAKESS